jgi:uncharacterized protein
VAAGWAVPMGVVGGLFGALFGSGGFLYALYLNSTLAQGRRAGHAKCVDQLQHGGAPELFLIAGVYADARC